MTRILLVSNYAWTVFNFRRCLIEALRRSGHDVYVQTQFDGYEDRLGLDSDHVLPLDIDRQGVNPVRDLRTIRSIYRAIRSVRADACLFFTIKPVTYGGIAAAFLGKPYVCNVTGLGSAFLGRPWLRYLAQSLFRVGLAKASCVFFQNREDRDLFVDRRIVGPERCRLLPGSGVDLSRFRPTGYPANQLPVFLLLARLIWDKGIGEFVEAARILKAKYPTARFQLLGPTGVLNPSSVRAEQVNAWKREGVIEYLGETDDVLPFIAAADCVVLPSYREGLPRSLLEAAAMARPIIATDTVGCRDAVDDGVTGLLCKVRDVNDLMNSLERMIAMRPEARANMGRQGRAKMEREFDERIVIERYLAAISEMLRDRDGTRHC